MPVQSIHHVSVLVSDTGKALAFYRDLLGLDLAVRPELGFAGAWLTVGAGQIHLIELPDPDSARDAPQHVGRDRHLALAVTDLPGIERRLREAGVAVRPSRSGRAALFCRDPDGNGVELVAVS